VIFADVSRFKPNGTAMFTSQDKLSLLLGLAGKKDMKVSPITKMGLVHSVMPRMITQIPPTATS